ncbi:transporter substrate-binding domain-containing protein (plasmid) [Skermanella mucosa]|uniref:transporter substrate-binding domain-containing protein n=1 Tax=Skermanella mucosa TaxID=1789672 RepID=UPI00192CA32C|nr:transporter substrate-binding domain-containing protein [Skermanella mucosa]UEM25239.1 transporter substrate-binding domain-containing protein [Skermanella mucosa]
MFSSTGPYSVVARSMLNGALLALEELNGDPDFPVELVPVVVNPGGELARYPACAADLLAGRTIRHVVGCYTSSSRKEVIPLFEKHDALLWYPSHYEGFESGDNVVYTGAAPNQHIVPLLDHLLAQCGRTAWCIGSNYIWAWENNRILRQAVAGQGGSVAAERYFAVGETDLRRVIEQILEARPSFVFNTLIGESAYQFLRDFRTMARDRGIDQPREIPVASCSLSEPELEAIGGDAVDGHLSSSVYFSSIASAANRAFVQSYRKRFPDGPAMSADAEASYVAMGLLARALAEAGTDDIARVKAAVTRLRLQAPQGEVWMDEDTFHAYLTPRIGRSNRNARFDIIMEAPQPVRPDPYLVWNSSRYDETGRPARNLKAVS